MKVSRSGCVRHAGVTVLEQRIPNPDVERVEVSQSDSGLRVSQKARAPDAGFRKATALEAAVDAIFHIYEAVIGILIAGVEMWLSHVPGLLHCNRGAALAIEGQPDESGIGDAVQPHHCARGLAVPDNGRTGRIFAHDAHVDVRRQNQGLRDPVNSARKKQYRRVIGLSEFIQPALNRERVIRHAVGGCSIGRLHVRPARERSHELVALNRNRLGGNCAATWPGRSLRKPEKSC